MSEVVVCAPVRTPIGRYGGVLRQLTAVDLGVAALNGLLDRTKIDPYEIDDVILGHGYGNSDAPAIGRIVALDAGLHHRVTGYHVDRRCGSGLQAVILAAMQVESGMHEVVVAGGVESMSNAAFYSTGMRWGAQGRVDLHDSLVRSRSTAGGRRHVVLGGMLETAENLRREYSIPREEQDLLALESHRRAVEAQLGGLFDDEIIPVTVPGRHGDTTVSTDEHPRADSTLEALGRLRPMRLSEDPDATVTAGNSSDQNDAGAMCLVMRRDRAEDLGIESLVTLRSWAAAGVEPERMGIGPVPATAAALNRARLSFSDIDVIELNEAFAAQALAVTRGWGFGADDFLRTNVRGSGISLGHPVGATGGRMLATLTRELHRRDARFGLSTMCVGGGQGLAAIFERVS